MIATAPLCRAHSADVIRQAPSGEGRVTVQGMTPAEFEPAYALAFSSLTGFDPTTVADLTGGTASVEYASITKQLMAARLVAVLPGPRQGRMVAAPDIARELSKPAYLFARWAMPDAKPQALAPLMAAMLGIDQDLARKLADVRRQMEKR